MGQSSLHCKKPPNLAWLYWVAIRLKSEAVDKVTSPELGIAPLFTHLNEGPGFPRAPQ